MKKSILFFALVFSLASLMAQKTEKPGVINARIKQQTAKPINNKQSSDINLNKLFKEFEVVSYRYSFPHSKYPELQSIIEIQCKGDAKLLSKELKSKTSHLLDEIIVRDECTPDIDPPNDYWYRLTMDSLTLDSIYCYLWHLPKIKAQKAWDITTGANDVIIASIDTDFDITHPDLENKIDPHYDPFTLIPHSARHESHGTATASFAGAETNGGGFLASIGYDTRLIGYVLDGSALEEAHHASFDMGADVITYSFGGGSRPKNDTLRMQ